jgi:acetyl-CoA acetyltransferase
MLDVAVIGVGQMGYDTFPERDMKGLFVEAFTEALADVEKGIDPKDIQEAFIGTLETGGNQLGNVAAPMTEQAHVPSIPARNIFKRDW